MKLELVASLAALAASCAAAADMPFGVKLYGINYDRRKNVDWSPNKCKTRDEVWGDMDVLSGMAERVRLYGMGEGACATADVLDASRGKMKVALGIWPENDSNFANELRILENLLRAGKIDDNVDGIHVGSEAIYRGNYSADKAIDYLNQVRALMKRYNKGNIKLTIADVVDSYYKNPQLLQAVDEISINQFSFWERVNVNSATQLMMDRVRSIRRQAADAGKTVLISETGWASGGNEPNASEATLANQRKFFVDFYQQATAQKLPYFWFAAFDNLWLKDMPKTSEVERYFGVMNMDRSIKSSFANLKNELAPRTQITFKGTSGRFLAETYNPNRIEEVTGVEMIAPSSDALTALRYQWFYDAAKGQVRSLNSDRCLDAYEGWNGGRVHVWSCVDSEPNQKWNYDATTKQLKHVTHAGLCLDNDSNNNYNLALWGCQANNNNQIYGSDIQVPESTAVRLIAKQSKDANTVVQLVRNGEGVSAAVGASGVAGSEWVFDSATNLVRSKDSDNKCLDAYEGWAGGRVHVWTCTPSEPNQRWSFDSATGQLRHLKHSGLCLDNDQTGNAIQLWGCHLNNNNQVWRMVSASAKVVKITNSDQSVVEWVSRDQQLLVAAAAKDAQVWFYNSYKNSIVNKWSGECLDADQPNDGGRVHTWDCIAGEGNQKWTFDNGLIKHVNHKGLCLAYKNAAEKTLVLKTCASSDPSQTFTLPLADASSAASSDSGNAAVHA